MMGSVTPAAKTVYSFSERIEIRLKNASCTARCVRSLLLRTVPVQNSTTTLAPQKTFNRYPLHILQPR